MDPSQPSAVSTVVATVDSYTAPIASITLNMEFIDHRRKQVRFQYSPEQDSSEVLAGEMVRALRLDDSARTLIHTALEERIDTYRREWHARA